MSYETLTVSHLHTSGQAWQDGCADTTLAGNPDPVVGGENRLDLPTVTDTHTK